MAERSTGAPADRCGQRQQRRRKPAGLRCGAARKAALIGCLALCDCAGGPSSSLMERDLRYAEYRCEWTYPVSVRLDDGFFWERLTPRSPMELRVAMVRHAVGELTGDNAYDAAVILAVTPGGQDEPYWYLAAMVNDGGRPDNVATVRMGDRLRVEDLTIRNRLVLVEVLPLSPGTPAPMARQTERRVYRLDGDRLVRVD